MVDYTKGTGNGGVMLIRDQGWSVEFHIRAGLSGTYVGSPGFGANAYVDNAWRGLPNVANISGTTWRHLGSHNATFNQNVIFHIDYSGTQGFGGPTDFNQYITRASVPAAPTPLSLDQIGHTSIRYRFSGNSNGGSVILEWQVGYGTDPTKVQYTLGSSGTSVVGGLSLGTRWYFWSRGRNAVGWGPWSTRLDARTLAGSRVNLSGVWKEAIAYVKVAGVWKQAIPFLNVAGTWKDGK
jgi:hypothetical protein